MIYSDISFSPYELLTGKMQNYLDDLAVNPRKLTGLIVGMDIAESHKNFNDDEIAALLLQQHLIRKVQFLQKKSIFQEEFENGNLRCLYYNERLDKNYTLLYSGCGPKNNFFAEKKNFLSKETIIKFLPLLEEKRLNKIKNTAEKEGKEMYYYAFQNSIRAYSTLTGKDKILQATTEIPLDFHRQLVCFQIGKNPVLECEHVFYEGSDGPEFLYFVEKNKTIALDCERSAIKNIDETNYRILILCENKNAKKELVFNF